MPLAPRMVRHSRAIASASRTLLSLPRLTCCGCSRCCVLEPAQVQRQQVALLQLERHVGELGLGELEAGERLAEHLARRGVVDRGLQAVAGRAERAEDDAEPRLVQAATAVRAARAPRAAPRSAGSRTSSSTSSAVIEARSDNLCLIFGRGEAGRVGRHDEARGSRRRSRPDHRDVGDRAVGDPHLGAVEDPVVAVRRARVRMPAGLEPKSGSVSPKQPIASPAAIRGSHCCFCSSVPNFQIANIASEPCTRHQAADAGVAGLELQAGQPVRDRVRAGAAVARQVHAEQAERAGLLASARGRASPRSYQSAMFGPDPLGPRTPGRSPGCRALRRRADGRHSSSSSGPVPAHRCSPICPSAAIVRRGLLDLVLAEQDVARPPARAARSCPGSRPGRSAP